ncbi:UNVERIFIED_CONTAM: hypothetical protein ODX26_09665 [Salmonella enterica subsp. enterica serovar Meleagridis]
MGLDIFLYSQHRQIVAVPAPYHPVYELSRDFSLITWVDKHVGEVENATCLELSREHIQQLKERLDCAIATFTEGNDAYSALFDHGLASKSDQRFASIRSTGNLTFSTAF